MGSKHKKTFFSSKYLANLLYPCLKFYSCSVLLHTKNACNQLDGGIISSETLKIFFSFYLQLQIPCECDYGLSETKL